MRVNFFLSDLQNILLNSCSSSAQVSELVTSVALVLVVEVVLLFVIVFVAVILVIHLGVLLSSSVGRSEENNDLLITHLILQDLDRHHHPHHHHNHHHRHHHHHYHHLHHHNPIPPMTDERMLIEYI